MRVRAALAGAALLAVALVSHGSARPPSEDKPLDPLAFRPVVIHRDPVDPTDPPPSPTLDPPTPEPATPRPTRPPAKQPEVKPKTESKPRPAPSSTGRSAEGVPTYYCRAGISACTSGYPDGPGAQLYAAAGPSLRVGNWRGRVVTVTAPSGRSVQVKLIDWCACGGSHFIDLYYDAFRLLGFPSSAKVSW